MRRSSRLLPKVATGVVLAVGVAGVALWPAWGCDRTQARKPIVMNPTTRQTPPVTDAAKPPPPATKGSDGGATSRAVAAAAVKPESHMLINNVWVTFPEAKLILRDEGDKVSAFLVSNDPPEVIQPNYQGNRYYFEMRLDNVDDVKNLAEADFRYKAPSAETQETQNGIFLDGDRQHLQPYDIQVTFDAHGDKVIADIRGQFIYFAKGNAVGQWVPVAAQLVARAEKK
jgi:hypothetical protein